MKTRVWILALLVASACASEEDSPDGLADASQLNGSGQGSDAADAPPEVVAIPVDADDVAIPVDASVADPVDVSPSLDLDSAVDPCAPNPRNACGGCVVLTATPGTACGACGMVQCDGTDATACNDPGANACGGCTALPSAPGAACGVCGAYQCNGMNATACNDPGANACGGCSTLPMAIGGACGTCGAYVCAGTNGVACADPYADPAAQCSAQQYSCGTVPDGCGNQVSCGACNLFQTCAGHGCECRRSDAVYANLVSGAPNIGGIATSPDRAFTAEVVSANTIQINQRGNRFHTLVFSPAGAISFAAVALAWDPTSAYLSVEISVTYNFGGGSVVQYQINEFDVAALPASPSPTARRTATVGTGDLRYRQMRYTTGSTVTLDNDCTTPFVEAPLVVQ